MWQDFDQEFTFFIDHFSYTFVTEIQQYATSGVQFGVFYWIKILKKTPRFYKIHCIDSEKTSGQSITELMTIQVI